MRVDSGQLRALTASTLQVPRSSATSGRSAPGIVTAAAFNAAPRCSRVSSTRSGVLAPRLRTFASGTLTAIDGLKASASQPVAAYGPLPLPLTPPAPAAATSAVRGSQPVG